MTEIIPLERITSKIYVIRQIKVMFDSDLAELYDVETGALNRAVKRNIERFPDDFMFQLSMEEWERLKCQFGISKSSHGGRRNFPYAFTEQGVSMLSSVLNSKRAIEVNIAIMRAFVQIRKMAISQERIAGKIREIESRLEDHDESIDAIFEAIVQLITPDEKSKKQIGFEVKEPKAMYGKEANNKH
jgi:hypothetical protein